MNTFITPLLKTLFGVLTVLLLSQNSYASHYRAGEILYEQIGQRKYKITAYTYTDPNSNADPNTLTINLSFGDGNVALNLPRKGRTALSSEVVLNTYEVIHQYSADGNYTISFFDQNRVNGIININNGRTELIAFYVETQIRINNGLGINRSPVLTKPPIDNGCKGVPYYHNPSAYDPDGDSLVFKLIEPRDQAGKPVPLYDDPAADSTFQIGLNDGQLYWDSPKANGIYNIAIEIREYRLGILVGYIVRDMQIFIGNCFNKPPLVQNVANGCVVVGDTITRLITASDPDVTPPQTVRLTGLGGAFATQNVARINPDPAIAPQTVSTQFRWNPSCSQIRYMDWQIIFEARDNGSAVSQNSFYVKVVAPPVTNLKTTQSGNGFNLTWNKDSCNLASHYEIYRRVDSSFWNAAYCETGIPASAGFEKIATIATLNNPGANVYFDNNNGKGLSPLINYCYRIVTIYPPRSSNGEIIYSYNSISKASVEICDNIILSAPAITKTSVLTTSVNLGRIELNFIKPDTIDSITYTPPYRFIVKRSEINLDAYTDIATFDFSSYSSIPTVSMIDSGINTRDLQYKYVVEMWANENGTSKVISKSVTASSVYTTIYSTDRTNILTWKYDVPWYNDTFIVYRKNALNVFDSIASTTSNVYADTGLVNKTEYCYQILTTGYYRSKSIAYRTSNYSQEICGTPIDTVRPCPPTLLVIPPCDQIGVYINKLIWAPITFCSQDVVKYRIYFKQLTTDEYMLLDEVPASTLEYIDSRDVIKLSITGCYYVTAVDSVGNESFKMNESCIENCPQYEIPNVFSPNGDGINDLLLPFPYRFVSRIDLVIYNRWGIPVFKTTNKDILWDGKDQESKTDLADGVYFYTCVVYEIYLDGVRKRLLNGSVQIIRK